MEVLFHRRVQLDEVVAEVEIVYFTVQQKGQDASVDE
jgi:hypothetical protein